MVSFTKKKHEHHIEPTTTNNSLMRPPTTKALFLREEWNCMFPAIQIQERTITGEGFSCLQVLLSVPQKFSASNWSFNSLLLWRRLRAST